MNKKTLIMLSTYNGEKYLNCLLDSLISQKDCDFDILVRDDGSSDGTTKILDKYQSENKLTWYEGENVGSADSFMSMIYDAPDYEYYALCDQDDYWEQDKLWRAIGRIKKYPSDVPVLYYGCPQVVNDELNDIAGYSNIDIFVDTFEGSLITSNSYGCTMVFNNALMKILKIKKANNTYMHDAWIHKVCLLFNGVLIYDPNVHIKYRQHDNNTVGISKNRVQSLRNHVESFFSKDCVRSMIIERLFYYYSEYMTDECKELCRSVMDYKKSFRSKLSIICNRKIKTESIKRNILFRLSILLNAY